MIRSLKAILSVTSRGVGVLAGLALLTPAGYAVEPVTGTARTAQPFGNLPLYFEASPDAAGAGFAFVARGQDCSLSVSATTAVLTLSKISQPAATSRVERYKQATAMATSRSVQLDLLGANANARVQGGEVLPGAANYFLGNDPAQWRSRVSLFSKVNVGQVYPGVDLVYYGNNRRLEYDFVVAPHADPAQIVLQFSGADKVRVDEAGDLVLTLGTDEIRQPKPVVYQTVKGARRSVAGSYVLSAQQTVTFKLGEYDRVLPLVIDPVLSFSTFFGGPGVDVAWEMATDSEGFVYVVGESMQGMKVTSGTSSNAFGKLGKTAAHGDVFVAKFGNEGTNLVYLTYLGGSTADAGLSIAVDAGGNAYITGYTDSTNYPVKNPIYTNISGKPYPTLNTHPIDAFVTKLSPSGSELVYSTYLGGNWIDEGIGIAVDANGAAYVAGYTESTNFPINRATGSLSQYSLGGDAFVAKVGPEGTNFAYSFYLGGNALDVGTDIKVATDFVPLVTGYTRSTNFAGSLDLPNGGLDAFLTLIENLPAGGLVTATNLKSFHYGGTNDNQAYRLALDAQNNAYLVGVTREDPTFPIQPSVLNPGGIYRSDDAGATWTLASVGLFSVVTPAVAVDPANAAHLVAATWHGMSQSADAGGHWVSPFVAATNTGFAPAAAAGKVLSVAFGQNDPARIYVGTAGEWVAASTNGGNTFSPTVGVVTSQPVNALAVNPTNANMVYAGTAAGVYRTADGGSNWVAFNGGLGNASVRALLTTADSLFAATAGGVYRTSLTNAAWRALNTGLSSVNVQALAIQPGVPTTLFAGTVAGFFRTTDSGTNWARVGAWTSNVTAVAGVPNVLYAGTTNGLYKFTEGSTNWVVLTNGPAQKSILSLTLNPTNSDSLYAGTKGIPYFGSNDVFVIKVGGERYSAVLGGSKDDEGWDVAVDGAGRAHLTGWTLSTNFPTKATYGDLRATTAGNSDAFVSLLGADGGSLEQSAYVGGSGADYGYALALDGLGNTLVAGATASANFPTYQAVQKNLAGSSDAFLLKIGSDYAPILSISFVSRQEGSNASTSVLFTWPGNLPDYYLEVKEFLEDTNGWVDNGYFGIRTNDQFRLQLNYPAKYETKGFPLFRLARQLP